MEDFTIIKPLIDETLRTNEKEEVSNGNIITFNGISWPSSSWEDGSRRSAFQPYRPTTVLTNLQRGNIQTNTPQLNLAEVTWFEKAGRGDITLQDIKTAHIDITDEDGLTALMWSSAYGQTTTVQMLIQAGADVLKKGRNDESALHLAAAGGHHDIICLLLTNGTDVNAVDCDGNTPLIYAVYGDHPHSVKELLMAGADITLTNFYEQGPYTIAVQMECVQAQLVLEVHLTSLLVS